MKKRVLSFLLCLLMVLPLLLVSCGGNTDPGDTEEEEELYVKPATLNFYIIGDTVTPDAAIEVEKAFNERCEEIYKTKVNFVYCTAQQYRERIMDDLADAKAAFSQSGAVLPSVSFENAPVETTSDDYGQPIEKYPEIGNNQIDILLITSKSMYDELRAADHLADLTEEINTNFRDIPQRVNTNLISAAKEDGRLYAVPNNVLIGTYKYVLVNKDLVYRLNYHETESGLMTSGKTLDYAKLRDFIVQVQELKDATNEADPELYKIQQDFLEENGNPTLFPLKAPFDFPTVSFLPKGDEKTVLGVLYDHNDTFGHEVGLSNVLLDKENPSYKDHMLLMLEARDEGYYPDSTTVVPENALYGVFYMEGSYTDRFQYEDDYFIFEVDQPRLEDDGAFDAMFAVSKYTASVTRSLEIIDALVADAGGELRNILQYGTDLYYNLDDKTGVVTRTATGRSQYVMNANYTGNMITAHPCLEDGRDENYASYFKTQNDSATRNPLYGLSDPWGETIENMVRALVCERTEVKISEEIGAMSDSAIKALKGADGKPSSNLTRQSLLDAIPKGHNFDPLREYWLYLNSGYDPTATYDSTPQEVRANNSTFQENKVDPILELARLEAEAFATNAAATANDYMEKALKCTTKAAFEELLANMESDKSEYLYAERGVNETNKLMGMLTQDFQSSVYNENVAKYEKYYASFTLAGYLKCWWESIKSTK